MISKLWFRVSRAPESSLKKTWSTVEVSRQTSSQYSLFIRRYLCSATFIILSKNNWSLLPLCFNLSLESAPFSLRQPHSGTSSSISYSPIHSPITSSSSDSPPCTSIAPSLFHSRPKIYVFHKSYPRSSTSSSRTASTDFCLHRFFWANRFCF